MTFRIDPSWTALLRAEPETGMGYQIVAARDSRSAPVVVVNAKVAVSFTRSDRVKESAADAELVTATLQQRAIPGMVRVLSRPEAAAYGYLPDAAKAGGGPANEAPESDSGSREPFRRYSAFQDDVRIKPDGSVTAGTYVTTLADGLAFVKTGMDAVRRYALPNPDPAVYVFEIVPPNALRVKRGTVAPAFGQPGGGAEVILINGAPAGSLAGRSTIPPGS